MLTIVQDDFKTAQDEITELNKMHGVNNRLEQKLNKFSKEK